jgi:hypothetical protein
MELIVDRSTLALPNGHQSAEDVFAAVRRTGPPMPVRPRSTQSFVVNRRTFLSCPSGRRVECDNDHELFFACKLVADEHNHWQQFPIDNTLDWIEETEAMEESARRFMEEEDDIEDDEGLIVANDYS